MVAVTFMLDSENGMFDTRPRCISDAELHMMGRQMQWPGWSPRQSGDAIRGMGEIWALCLVTPTDSDAAVAV